MTEIRSHFKRDPIPWPMWICCAIAAGFFLSAKAVLLFIQNVVGY